MTAKSGSVRPRHVGLLVVGAVGAVLALSLPRLLTSDQDRLRQLPEASLLYPGATVLRQGGHDAAPGVAAGIWTQLSTDASADDVLAWYQRGMAANGWETGGGSSVGLGTHESQACAWHTAEIVLRVSFWKPEAFRKQYPADGAHVTVYELRLIGHGNSINIPACGHV